MADIQARIVTVAKEFAAERTDRQQRRTLDRADFDRIAETGYLRAVVPVDQGGPWTSFAESTPAIAEMLRVLASGDSSVALVSSMHPSVVGFWLVAPDAPEPYRSAYEAQRRAVFELAQNGQWWGTITSEPGSGGDIARTNTVAAPDGHGKYRITGQKHFGSGFGIVSKMVTTAKVEGESEPDWFIIDVSEGALARKPGLTVVAPWDGHGMIATQSHAINLNGMPAERIAWPGNLNAMASGAGGAIACFFTAVITGITETAIEAARAQLGKKKAQLRPYEMMEWTRAELEGWLVRQAYDGMLRAMAAEGGNPRATLLAKTAVAELAESALGRLCKVVGGGSFSRQSPFGNWLEDVRALGFLRPPWPLAFDRLFAGSFPDA